MSPRPAPSSPWVIDPQVIEQLGLPSSLHRDWLADEADVVAQRLGLLESYDQLRPAIVDEAASSEEGVLLMCLAEALLRIPDDETAERLIEDKLAQAQWDRHLGRSDSLFVNASTWGLMLTGRLVRLDEEGGRGWRTRLRELVKRSGEPVVQLALKQAMKIMARQFVMGRDIRSALRRAQDESLNSDRRRAIPRRLPPGHRSPGRGSSWGTGSASATRHLDQTVGPASPL